MPRNLQYIIYLGIGLLVFVFSILSIKSPTAQKDENRVPSASAALNQLNELQELLNRARREAKEKQEREQQLRRAAELRSRQSTPVAGALLQPERDAADERERERQARAPFAPSIVVRITEPKERETKASDPQLVFQAERSPVKDRAGEHRSSGSGSYLPEREGSLYRVYQGTTIQTALLHRLEGSFTGPVKCGVTVGVRSKDGSAVLIPVGALFLGEARRVEERNQRRLAVWFERLLLPNGYSVQLKGTPGLNARGETGLKDKTDNHYLQRFSFAGAIGLLGGVRLYGGRPDPYGFESGVISGLGGAAAGDLSRRMNDVPTITIREGHVVNVYLSEDLLLPEYGGL